VSKFVPSCPYDRWGTFVKIALTVAMISATTCAVIGLAGPAFATTPQPPRTVDSVKARVDAKAKHITDKMQALQGRLTRPKLAPAKTTLQADITKVLADTAAWRKQIDGATTLAGIQVAAPAHQAVKADLSKLRADLAAARGTKDAGK